MSNETLKPPSPTDPVAQRIVAAARGHFFQHGFRHVSMDDLAAEMGMSKKTLYVHFRSKRALLEQVIAQKLGALEADLDAIQSGTPGDFEETLHRLLGCMQGHSREITPTFVRDVAKEDPSLFEMIRARRREVLGRTFGRILRVGQEAGAVRRDLSAEQQVQFLLGMVDALANPENMAAMGSSPSDYLKLILSVFLHGVMTEKGTVSL